ncbi:zinc finger and BTB domain-containing protein 22 isoform X2 [Entelurus aequoreus]|uniref:zinc finger and BTB domain-containing protein 22 isoform X2 n=1 Tax=Entelurus aequoreus TaxID=161455 RepID=UPI002B1E4558|nr:zinc finger and BTB domain-containing protein 22 isoform X2 [Entelurus aequoreus]
MTMDPSSSALTAQVCFPAARAAVLDNLNRQREEGRLCDLSIHVQGKVYRAHRCVLAASSPYFHDQVLLKNVTSVSLPSVMDPVAFESVLSSAYTGQLSIVHDDIVNYVTVASFLQMWHIVDKCTEILKRQRPSADVNQPEASAAHPGSASRQQSPSSTDCLYGEREGRRKVAKPDTLPPLATWRRPQQFSRWGVSRPSSAQPVADSQLDTLPGFAESNYACCEETWTLNHNKSGHFGHSSSGAEGLKQKPRCPPRGALQSADRPLDKNMDGGGDGDEMTQKKKKSEKRAIEADEGVGEAAVEKREGFAQISHIDLQPMLMENEDLRRASVKVSAEDVRDRAPRSTDLSSVHACHKAESTLVASCVVPTRVQWQAGPWSQQESRPQEREEGGKSEDDFKCLSEGNFNRDTYDEIEDGTGQVSQRPLVPPSADFTSSGMLMAASGSPLTSASGRHVSPSSATLPPPSSPPTPSSSSSVTMAGAPYSGKVHFCHCGKAFTLKSMRDRHVKMQHLNLRPFGCPVCTKSFKMKHHLTKHLKTHGGLRPYECGACGKKVIWRDSFLRHQARCERVASEDNNTSSAQADLANSYGYAFHGGDAFLAMGGQVKVEEVDFHGEMEDGMSGLLGSVSRIVDELRTENLDTSGHVYKEEASEGFSESK